MKPSSQPQYDGLPRAIDLPAALRAQLELGIDLSTEERDAYEAVAAGDIASLGEAHAAWLSRFEYRSHILDGAKDDPSRRRRRAAALAFAALQLHERTGEPILHGSVRRDRFIPDDRRNVDIVKLIQGRHDALFLARELGRFEGSIPL